MKNLYKVLPPFAPDYGGVCEVAYELGGLVLIHDASGCTVNYTTFDEPRWAEKPSDVFCSGLREIEAVMGDDSVIINKAVHSAKALSPNFIAYVGSSVPMVVGTDFEGIAEQTQAITGIPSFGFDANGIGSYTDGASRAMTSLISRFCGKKTENKGVNLLGLLPLDFDSASCARRFKSYVTDLRHTFPLDCSFDGLCDLQNAALNIVVSESGLAAARYMEKRFGIPYKTGIDMGETDKHGKSVLFVGDRIIGASLTKALGGGDTASLFDYDEEGFEKLFKEYDNIIADPCFCALTDNNFIPLPSVAVSGGTFRGMLSVFDADAIRELLV